MNKNVRSILAIILAVILVALVGTYAILKVRSRNDKVPDGTSGESRSESRSAEVTASESENGNCMRCASERPTVDLPLPGMPTRIVRMGAHSQLLRIFK